MREELVKAVLAHTERKRAVGFPQGDGSFGGVSEFGEALGLLSGTDLDVPELLVIMQSVQEAGARAIETGIEAGDIAPGMWLDGLLTGMRLMEERKARGE